MCCKFPKLFKLVKLSVGTQLAQSCGVFAGLMCDDMLLLVTVSVWSWL